MYFILFVDHNYVDLAPLLNLKPLFCLYCVNLIPMPWQKRIRLKLVSLLSCSQASIILQLRTGHIGLNKFLHRIKCADTPLCLSCNNNSIETINHFLFKCRHYCHERHILQNELQHNASNASYLLSNPTATLHLLKYIHTTGRLKKTFGAVYSGD